MALLIAACLLAIDAEPAAGGDAAGARAAAPPATAAASGGRPPRVRRAPAEAPDKGDEEQASSKPSPGAGDEDDEEEGRAQPASAILVTAHRLDAARTRIDAALGATVYSLTNDAIENRPGGETGNLSEILAQAPGVTLSGPTINIRGAPANQVRINDVIVPEAIPDPADLISSRLAETTRLISGTLPAQFGFAPAGVISVTTKNGLYQHGGEAEMFAGSSGMIEPAFEWAGSAAQTSLFASGELEHDRTPLADVAGARAGDRRTRIDGLGFADHIIGSGDRLSVIFGGSRERHRIGETSIPAGSETNENGYGVAAYQHSAGGFTVQGALFAGTAADEAQFGSTTRESRTSWGTQIDASQELDEANVLRFGLLATRSTARELDLGGRAAHDSRTSLAVYGQDEWKPARSVTFVPGARLEWLDGTGSAPTLEPRANLVWEWRGGLTFHAGYARYAAPPPVGEASAATLPDERDDYFDAGVQRKVGSLTLGLDAYRRIARNYLTEQRTPGSATPIAFGFRRGRIEGVELSGTYSSGSTSAWANVSFARAEGQTIVGGEGLFPVETIAAAAAKYVPLASERPVTVSAGLTQRIGDLSLGGDALLSSGAVRTLDPAKPNGGRHSPYALLGLAAVYHARIAARPADLRLDLMNLGNLHGPSTDASSLEGGWTRPNQGRSITIGIEQRF
jgi:hypothetical protein